MKYNLYQIRLILLVVLLTTSMNIIAQDTISMGNLCGWDGYDTSIVQIFDGGPWNKPYSHIQGSVQGWYNYKQVAMGYHTNKAITIVGVAAICATWKEAVPEEFLHHLWTTTNQNEYTSSMYGHVYDTTYTECFSWFRLYKHVNSSVGLAVLAENIMHVLDTNVICYFYDTVSLDNSNPPVPVRAVYFEEPQIVCDSFFVGIQNSTRPVTVGDRTWRFNTWPIYILTINDFSVGNRCIASEIDHDATSQWFFNNESIYLGIFPLVEYVPMYPSPLTNEGTVGLSQETLEQFVQLFPNPVSTSATLFSSLRMNRISLYDLAGNKVLEQRCDGNIATLDLRALPQGAYVATIETIGGTTTKKLIKQ